jgi:hypothetical protein
VVGCASPNPSASKQPAPAEEFSRPFSRPCPTRIRKVDAILRDTVATWRFSPLIVDGKPVKACTQKTFKLTFRGQPLVPCPQP